MAEPPTCGVLSVIGRRSPELEAACCVRAGDAQFERSGQRMWDVRPARHWRGLQKLAQASERLSPKACVCAFVVLRLGFKSLSHALQQCYAF